MPPWLFILHRRIGLVRSLRRLLLPALHRSVRHRGPTLAHLPHGPLRLYLRMAQPLGLALQVGFGLRELLVLEHGEHELLGGDLNLEELARLAGGGFAGGRHGAVHDDLGLRVVGEGRELGVVREDAWGELDGAGGGELGKAEGVGLRGLRGEDGGLVGLRVVGF